MERETNDWVLDKIGSVFSLRKSMAEMKVVFFGYTSSEKTALEKD